MKLQDLKFVIRDWNNTQCREASNLPSLVTELTQLDDLEDRDSLNEEQISRHRLLHEHIENLTV